ncbi:MAG: 30S ribosomal protein S12 methylthiotransferase RimO [Actinomycetota bacterium]|nr:30S ribosomal protein S12 methylthiotransferase RimO [Actinomycetota bacterium]
MPQRYWIETLGCPKNAVDSAKLAGTLHSDGFVAAETPEDADLVVVNTCAFIEPARAESVETILELSERRRASARLVVTGCLAERAGAELAEALPEVDLVAGFGVPVQLRAGPRLQRLGDGALGGFDLLELERPRPDTPWAYVKVAEGCDRKCGFCAIPSFRGAQRSRSAASVLAEVDALAAGGVREIVLVAQDLASYGRDDGRPGALIDLMGEVRRRVERVRLLYLYPSALTDALIDAVIATDVAYFDLSLQHVSSPLLRKMRRVGSAERFLERIATIRERAPHAALRSSFILGYPGETEEDHDALLAFLAAAELDWAGFFAFSEEPGTYAAGLEAKVPAALATERLRECAELQDALTAKRRADLVGSVISVLVDAPGVARSHREAPEIDGVVQVDPAIAPGSVLDVMVHAAEGPDLFAEALAVSEAAPR